MIVPRPDREPTAEEIIAHCRGKLGGFKIPRGVDFRSDPLPKSGAGKTLKRDIRAPYWEGRGRMVN